MNSFELDIPSQNLYSFELIKTNLMIILQKLNQQELHNAIRYSNICSILKIRNREDLILQLSQLFQTHQKKNKLNFICSNLSLLVDKVLKEKIENVFGELLKSENKINKECYCNEQIDQNQASIMCLRCKKIIHKNCSYLSQNKYTFQCPKCFITSLQPLSQVRHTLKTVKTDHQDKQVEININLINVRQNQYVQIRCVKICDDWELTSRISWPQFYKIEINGTVYKSYQKQRKTVRLDKQIPFEIFPTQFRSKTVIKIKMAPSRQRFQKTKRYSHLFSVVVVKHLSHQKFKSKMIEEVDDLTIHNCSIRQRFKQNVKQNLHKQQTISLNCPITQTRIVTPARGSSCYHLQCFDLDNFLQMSTTLNNYKCPVFKCYQKCYKLKIDPALLKIIQQDKQNKIKDVVFNINGVFTNKYKKSTKQINHNSNKNSQTKILFEFDDNFKENCKQANIAQSKVRNYQMKINNIQTQIRQQQDQSIIDQILMTNYCKSVINK